MTSELHLASSDIPDTVDQTPTLTEALGCMDCNRIFRTGSHCPFCLSMALLNVADCLGNQNIVQRLKAARIADYK